MDAQPDQSTPTSAVKSDALKDVVGLVGLVVSLLTIGAPMLGIPINIYLGTLMYITACVLISWFILRHSKLRKVYNSLIVVALALIFVAIIGVRLWAHFHDVVQVRTNLPSPEFPATKPAPLPTEPDTKPTKKPTTDSKRKLPPKQGANENKPVPPINTGACSNVQVEGRDNSATTNCTFGAAPPRTLSPEQVTQFVSLVKRAPGKFSITYSQNDEEAYSVAKQIGDALVQGGWTSTAPLAAAITVTPTGPPLRGIMVRWKGDALIPGKMFSISLDEPAGCLMQTLETFFPKGVIPNRNPDNDGEQIHIWVEPNPAPNTAN
jgi:hypothetical protein